MWRNFHAEVNKSYGIPCLPYVESSELFNFSKFFDEFWTQFCLTFAPHIVKIAISHRKLKVKAPYCVRPLRFVS